MKKIMLLVFFAFFALCSSAEKYNGHKLIGYLPIYASGAPLYNTIKSGIEKTDFSKLTHVIIAFVFSDSLGNISYYNNYQTGAWSPENTVDSIIAIAKKNNVKVLISLGSDVPGWKMTLKPETRANFIENIKKILIDKKLDGLDLDLEGGWDATAPFYYKEYELLAAELRESFADEFYLTAAIGYSEKSWDGTQLWTEEFVKLMDWVNIMVYDMHLWSPTNIQNPSSFEDQLLAASNWGKYLDKEKLVFGVPFYSNGWNYDDNKRYAIDICWWLPCAEGAWQPFDVFNYFVLDSLFDLHPDQDSIIVTKDDELWIKVDNSQIGYRGSHNGIIYLNGRTLLKKKAKWAIDNGYGGIMIWELVGDVPTSHPNSLLNALAEQFRESTKGITAIVSKNSTMPAENNISFLLQNRTLKISLKTTKPTKIIITDSRGRLLYSQTENSKSVSIPLSKKRFANGIYQLTISQDNAIKSAKFLLK